MGHEGGTGGIDGPSPRTLRSHQSHPALLAGARGSARVVGLHTAPESRCPRGPSPGSLGEVAAGGRGADRLLGAGEPQLCMDCVGRFRPYGPYRQPAHCALTAPRHAELPRDRTLERGTLDLPAGHPGSERGEGGRTVSEEEGSGSKGNLGRRSSLAGPLGRSAVLPSLAGAPSSPHTARHRFR